MQCNKETLSKTKRKQENARRNCKSCCFGVDVLVCKTQVSILFDISVLFARLVTNNSISLKTYLYIYQLHTLIFLVFIQFISLGICCCGRLSSQILSVFLYLPITYTHLLLSLLIFFCFTGVLVAPLLKGGQRVCNGKFHRRPLKGEASRGRIFI